MFSAADRRRSLLGERPPRLLQITLAMNFLCKALLPVLWSFRKEPSAEAGRESWRVQMRRKSILLAPLILLCLCSGLEAQQLWSGILAANRATDWTRAGVQGGIPQRATICATLSPGVSAAQISRAISSCPANQVVFLSAGTYELSEQITFGTRSNVTLRGAGADQTILRFSGGGSCSGLPSTICVRSAWVDALPQTQALGSRATHRAPRRSAWAAPPA
jgi:hypothetical protein